MSPKSIPVYFCKILKAEISLLTNLPQISVDSSQDNFTAFSVKS